ncbi:hypothetical protein H0X32_03475 [Patescibacteria group bacterium]|nr:hypothetical protein [Patescibacteria group bacterium]
MMKKLAYIGTSFALPFFALAQTTVNSAQSLGAFIITFINTVAVPVIFAIAFIVFVFGVFQYFIFGRGNEEAAKQGRSLMLYGLIGFFLMVSVWGLVNILVGSIGLDRNVPTYPHAPTR